MCQVVPVHVTDEFCEYVNDKSNVSTPSRTQDNEQSFQDETHFKNMLSKGEDEDSKLWTRVSEWSDMFKEHVEIQLHTATRRGMTPNGVKSRVEVLPVQGSV